MGSIDRFAFELEVLRGAGRCLGRGGIHHDGDFLFPTAPGKFPRFDEERDPEPDRLRGGFSQHRGNAVIHGG